MGQACSLGLFCKAVVISSLVKANLDGLALVLLTWLGNRKEC